MQPAGNIPLVLLRALAVGAVAGALLWLAGLAPARALIVGLWVMMGAAFAQQLPRQPRRGLALFGYGSTLLFYLMALVLPALGYAVDWPLLLLVMLVCFGVLLIEQYRPRLRRAGLLYAGLAAGALSAGLLFVSPCSLGPCRPASWQEQLALSRRAAADLGEGWVLDGVSAWPAARNIFWFAEQPNLEVTVFLGRTTPDPAGGELPYPTGSLSYNDLDPARTLARSGGEGWSNAPPDPADTAALEAVQIGPREALNAARTAQRAAGGEPLPDAVTISLELGDGAQAGAAPVWQVSYIDLDRDRRTRFWVSALDGSVLRREETAR